MAAVTVTLKAWVWWLTEYGSKVPTGAKAEKKEDLEKGKQKKSNKNSMSPPTLFPSAMLLRELMFL